MPIDYTKRSTPEPEPTASPTASPTAPPTAPGAVGLSKVTLTKSAPTVSLAKQGASLSGILRVNLNWNARPAGSTGGGFLKRLAGGGGGNIDLDLGCLYELADGTKSVVQALGGSFTSRNAGTPIISLDGDDRSGTASGGENLSIDLSRLREIKRVLIFAMIYEGVTSWAAADGVVTLYPVGSPEIEVRLDEHDDHARVCAIALLENTGGDLAIRREVRYVRGAQRALDEAYGWGLKWQAGHK